MAIVASRTEREYVQNWARTGRLLEDVRWSELRRLDEQAALRATESLLDAAARVPLPSHRRAWSGLVHLQEWLRRRRPL
jgi:hypothetical protein